MWEEVAGLYSDQNNKYLNYKKNIFIEKVKKHKLYHSMYQFTHNANNSRKAIWILLHDSCSDESDELYEYKIDSELEDNYEILFYDKKVELEVLREILRLSGGML